MAISSVNILLLASCFDCMSGYSVYDWLTAIVGFPPWIMLEGATPVVEAIEGTPAVPLQPHGHPVPVKTGCNIYSKLTCRSTP